MKIKIERDACIACVHAVTRLVDRGAAAGKLKILDGEGALLCEIALDRPAFHDAFWAVDLSGACLGSVAFAVGFPKTGRGTAAAGAGKRAAKYIVTDSDDVAIWSAERAPPGMVQPLTLIAEGESVTVLEMGHRQPSE